MPFILGLIGILAAAYFWMHRARDAAEMAKSLAEVPGDIKAAARRFGFKRKLNAHAVDAIEDPKIALAGIGNCFIELSRLPTQDQRDWLLVQLQSVLEVSREEAEELLVLGRWLMNESGGPELGVTRLSRQLSKIAQPDSFQDLMQLLKAVLKDDWSEDQHAALHEVKRAFRIS